jgi:sigma-B regulation protein RsbU (phosphoserine phosphatase)
MIAAPIPRDEVQRLAELHALDILDTPREERFDRVVRLLKLVLRVPIAYMSLIDSDRQWMKSACGLKTIETTRDISFCGHAILSDEIMIVPDALEDDRFRDNPMVIGDPYIRFYAGRPLRGPGGSKVGTLCVADRSPRTFRADELEIFSELASIVERELGLVETVALQQKLIASRNRLSHEMAQASQYVLSLLPEPIEGLVGARRRFEPSSELGGDFFGYDWIDDDHFVVYLLDVSGHGVGAALLSISVGNALRGRSLPGADFRDPSSVLARLNESFPMDRHDEKYFTIWYGVYNNSTRTLTYAGGGHPPAVLLTGLDCDRVRPVDLGAGGPPVGVFAEAGFERATVSVEPSSKLYVFSDGAYEIPRPGGSMMTRRDLVDFLASIPAPNGPDEVWRFILGQSDSAGPIDDFSFIEIDFR